MTDLAYIEGVTHMSIEYWIALGVSILSLIILGIGIVIAIKRIKHTLNNMRNLQAEGNRKVTHYSSEVDFISQRVEKLNTKANTSMGNAKEKAQVFDTLSTNSSELSETVQIINENKKRLAKDVLKTSGKEAKEKGPELLKLMKKTIKKTVRKQKERYIG